MTLPGPIHPHDLARLRLAVRRWARAGLAGLAGIAGLCARPRQHLVGLVATSLLLAAGSASAAGTLQAEWTFETTSAGTTPDSSGNGRTLTLGTGQSLTGGIAGSGLLLPGTTAAQTAAAAVNTNASFTVAAWVKYDTLACTYQTAVSQDGVDVSGFFLEVFPSACSSATVSTPRFEFMMLGSDNDAATWYAAISSTVPQVGVWYHIAGVRDTAAGNLKLYVNGVLEATTSYTNQWNATGRVAVGRSRWNGVGDDYMDGTVDGVRLYQGAFTAAEVAALSLEPMAHWRTDEAGYSGAAGEVLDSSGLGNHASRVGSASTTTNGKVCGALQIAANTSGTVTAVDSGIAPDSQIGARGSVAFWYRSTSAWGSGNDVQLLDATTTANQSFHLVRRSNGSVRAAITDSSGTTLSVSTANLSFGANTWVHLVLAWRFAAGSNASQLQVFVNGSATSVTGTTSGALHSSIGTLYLGDNRNGITSNNATVNSADGSLDEVRLYKYPLNGTQVSADAALTRACPALLDHVEAVPDSSSALTCASATVTVKACANSACTTLLSGYTGTVNLTTGTGRGDWAAGSGPAPQGSLANGTAGDGAASYTFVAADGGSARLRLTHALAQDVTVTVVDSATPATARTSAAIQFRDNAFVFGEDAANRITGTDVVVAGRPHDLTLTLIKTDPATGACGTATEFTGSRNLKFWRTDVGGPWTAPSVVTPALSVPASLPAAANLTLAFNSGVAAFSLGTTDIGRYSLNARDDSLAFAAAAVAGSSNTLTVRPFAVVISAIRQGAVNNPGGSAATDAVFAKAGTSFQASVGAYRWTAAMAGNGTDTNDDGLPDSGATLANTTAGGLAPSFNSTLTLTPLAGSQTPTGGTLGTLANGSITAFSGGSATPTTLQYSEVGSFALATTGVVGNFLGSGLALDATVFNSAGAQSTRVGRFTPARFAASAASLTHRSAALCSPASAFTYLGENFQLRFTLTAQNANGATTLNYGGSFAKLDPASAAAWQLAGVAGSTFFRSTGATPRLALGSASGSWTAGVAANVTLTAQALRASSADGPFNAAFGIAPQDSDGVVMAAHDLDTDADSVADRTTQASVALRFGRLRLFNAIGAAERPLALPLVAQYWDGSAFAEHTQDSCTRLTAAQVSFGNYRKTLTAADTALVSSPVTLANGRASLVLAAPAAGRSGTVDVALSLGSSATDASCLQPWTPGSGDAASAGANLAFLRGAWCSTGFDRDPAARASFGLHSGASPFIQRREHY